MIGGIINILVEDLDMPSTTSPTTMAIGTASITPIATLDGQHAIINSNIGTSNIYGSTTAAAATTTASRSAV